MLLRSGTLNPQTVPAERIWQRGCATVWQLALKAVQRK